MIPFTLLLGALFSAHGAPATAHSEQPAGLSQNDKSHSPSLLNKTAVETARHSAKDPSGKTPSSPSHSIKRADDMLESGGELREKAKKSGKKQEIKQGKKQGIKTKNTRTYYLTVDYKTVNLTGKKTQAMAVNGSLPAPALYFTEGETARIHVTNQMDVETSIHWHGILLPNFQDGVPYLTTPPIEPGKTHTFTFPLKQSGTYWYHSHTGLQEQRGIYGAIVIEPKERRWKDLVLVLSDWTDENPNEILRNLKRGSEWPSIKKDTVQSLDRVIRGGALGAQLRLWGQRMPGMDISDVYYPAFLVNGKKTQTYPRFSDGKPVRLRVINASASTYFWLSFGGATPLLISADGLDIQPVPANKVLHAIGETYDFLLTPPKGKAVEFLAVAQDGSGFARALIGKGGLLKAPPIPKPDLIEQMKHISHSHGAGTAGHEKSEDHKRYSHGTSMAGHKKSEDHKRHSHGASMTGHKKPEDHKRHSHGAGPAGHKKSKDHKRHSSQNTPITLKSEGSHKMGKPERNLDSHHPSMGHKHHKIPHQAQPKSAPAHKGHSSLHGGGGMSQKLGLKKHKGHISHGENSSSGIYEKLKALKNTGFSKALPVKEIKLNLTGNMWRYVWSLNGKTLSESDKIKIRKNEVVRLILHNKTMMHHPMHLHGHFFRVLTGGARSPLKHTVDVPPMKTVTLEFAPDESGDWFFHCHILYHMQSGMSRVFQTGDGKRAPGLKGFPASRVLKKDRKWRAWGELAVMTNRADLNLQTSNTRNKISLTGTLSWVDSRYRPHTNYEGEGSYERFLTDFFRVYVGGEAEHSAEGEGGQADPPLDLAGKIGIRYLLPYFIELDVSLDQKKRLEIELEYEVLLFPRLELFAEWAYRTFPLTGDFFQLPGEKGEQEWSVGLDYIVSRDLSLTAGWSNHFSYGAGILYRF